MAQRIKIGDIVQVKTPKGLAYAQYTHQNPMLGPLLRVFPGVYDSPQKLDEIIEQPPAFSTFFPLQEAVKRELVEIVGNLPVPDKLRPFPLFRAATRDLKKGGVSGWWLWDGAKEWKIGELTAEQRHLPIREIVNDTLLVERIISGWTAEVMT